MRHAWLGWILGVVVFAPPAWAKGDPDSIIDGKLGRDLDQALLDALGSG